MSYTVEVRVGVLTSNVNLHTWLYVKGPDGQGQGFGFYPVTDSLGNLIHGNGDVRDDTPSDHNASSGPMTITESQYQALMDYINRTDATPPAYSLPFGSQCTNWALHGLVEAGIIPNILGPRMELGLLQTAIFNPILEALGFKLNDLIQSISNIVSTTTPPTSPDGNDNTYRIVYYDPLVLDLDGDGIETISGAQGSGVLFDHNADGIRTTSGWLKGDDGLLVRDINANGMIDTGAELFGDSTRLANGATAANGFAALADLDSNQDGQVNNQDSAFNELRVWRDGDQDGVTDPGELFSLDEVGVSSLNAEVSGTPNITLTGGIQAETGSFTWTNGSTGVMADMNFTEDTFHSQYTTAIDIPVELQNLPNIAGMGRLLDLREAAALSPALANVLTLYSAATTRAEQKALLSEVLLEWAKTDPLYTESPVAYYHDWVPMVPSPTSTNIIYLRPGEALPAWLNNTGEIPDNVDQELLHRVRVLDAYPR